MTAARWEHFEHPADIGLRGRGATPAEAFEQAALALTAVMTDPAAVREALSVDIHCSATDLESLLVDWLNALLYEMAVRRVLFSGFDVRIAGTDLRAIARGEPMDPGRHGPAVEVKAATYHALKVEQQADGSWLAQCVVDV